MSDNDQFWIITIRILEAYLFVIIGFVSIVIIYAPNFIQGGSQWAFATSCVCLAGIISVVEDLGRRLEG